MLPQPLAHIYSLLTAQLHTHIPNYSNSFCVPVLTEQEKQWGEKALKGLKMNCPRFAAHTSNLPVFKLALAKPLKQPPGDYLQHQIVADFRSRDSTGNHQTQKVVFSKELKAAEMEEPELEELSLNSHGKGNSLLQSLSWR